MKSRKYSGSAVAMLTVSSVIVDNAIADETFLISKRASWGNSFFSDLKQKIENGFGVLGIDKIGGQRQATIIVLQIQKDALSVLSEVKVQISEDFKKDKVQLNEILTALGFNAYHKQALNKDQNALVQLLYQFKENLTPALHEEIEAKGTARESLDALIGYADALKEANITQETLKSTSKTLTEKDNAILNDVYDEIISVAKIARVFYKGNAAKQDQYSYTKILSKLSTGVTKKA